MSNRKNGYKQNIFMRILRFFLCVILLPVLLIYFIANVVKKFKQKKREKELVNFYSETQLDSLSGIEFEMLLNVKGNTCAVQAKRYSGTVGVAAVQEVVSAKSHYGCREAMVVTNSTFSAEAKVLAGECNVDLIERDRLKSLLLKFNVKIEKLPSRDFTLTDAMREEMLSRYKFWI